MPHRHVHTTGDKECWGNVRNKPIQQPHQRQDVPDRRVPPDVVPAEDEIHVERHPRGQGREEDEHRRRRVVGQLEQDDLLHDLQRGEVAEGPGAWGAAAGWGHGSLSLFLKGGGL